jgi:two-component system response regulator YesN
LINERNTDVKNNMSQKQMSINFVKYYIANNLSNNELSLTEISDKLHVNPSYLSRIFKEVTGTTLSKYIITLRMHKACELLEKKLYSVKDITFMVGYSDPHYFSTEFSEHIGICPKNYTSEGIFKKM